MQREENDHKLCFSQADTTAKNHKNIKFAHWSIQQLPFHAKITYSTSPTALYACQKSINRFSKRLYLINHSIWKKKFWNYFKLRYKSIRATCHVQSDVLCYMWNHAERPLNINARPLFSFNIRKNIFCRAWYTLTQQASTSMFNFSAHLTEHCTTSERAQQGDWEFFFSHPKLNVSRLGDRAPLEHSLGYEFKKKKKKKKRRAVFFPKTQNFC